MILSRVYVNIHLFQVLALDSRLRGKDGCFVVVFELL